MFVFLFFCLRALLRLHDGPAYASLPEARHYVWVSGPGLHDFGVLGFLVLGFRSSGFGALGFRASGSCEVVL